MGLKVEGLSAHARVTFLKRYLKTLDVFQIIF